MQFVRHKLKELIFFLIILAPILIVYTILLLKQHASNDFNIFRKTTFIIGIIILLLTGFFSGMIEQKKGWFAGLSTALLIMIIVFIIQLTKGTSFGLEHLIKYLAYFASSILGGIIGVNIKLTPKH